MDCGCNCFGIAAASKVSEKRGSQGTKSRVFRRGTLASPTLPLPPQVPVKRYNTLVPDIFPVAPPKFGAPLDAGARRKIGKLGDYLACTPHRAPKASRRLARKAHAELARGRLGYVSLAAAAYGDLLSRLPRRDGGLLARDLVSGPPAKHGGPVPPGLLPHPAAHSVVGALLRHPHPAVVGLGAGLLVRFADTAADADDGASMDALAADAAAVGAGRAPVAIAAAPSRGLWFGGGQEPSPPPATATSFDAARAACLEAGRAYIRYCVRVSRVPRALEAVSGAALDVAAAGGGEMTLADGSEGVRPTADGTPPPPASPPATARALLVDILALTKESADGARVAGALLTALDARGAWRPGGEPLRSALADAVDAACSAGPQLYVVFSELVRHAARARGAAWGDRAATLAAAARQGGALGPALASPALALLLKELPGAMADEVEGGSVDGDATTTTPPFTAVAERLCALVAGRTGDAARLVEALSAGLGPALPGVSPSRGGGGGGVSIAPLERASSTGPPSDPRRVAALRRAALACTAAAARGAAAAGVAAAGGRASGLPRALAAALLAAAADGDDPAARRSALAALAALLGGGGTPVPPLRAGSPRRPPTPTTPRAGGAPPPPTAERVRDGHARSAAAVAFVAATDPQAAAIDAALAARVLAAAADHAPRGGRAAADLAALPCALLDSVRDGALGPATAGARVLVAADAARAAARAAGVSLTLPPGPLADAAAACPGLRLAPSTGLAVADAGDDATTPLARRTDGRPLPRAAVDGLTAAVTAALRPSGSYTPPDIAPRLPAAQETSAAASSGSGGGGDPPSVALPPRAPSSGGRSATAAAGGKRPPPPSLAAALVAAAAGAANSASLQQLPSVARVLDGLAAKQGGSTRPPAPPAVLPGRGGALGLVVDV